jgi:hypothetical protein
MESYKEDLAKLCCERHERLKSATMPWHDEWQQISEYFAPRLGTITVERFDGDLITETLYCDVGIEAAEDFASGCTNYIVPPGEEWARYESNDEDASESVREYWSEATKTVLSDMVASSFHLSAQEDFFLSAVYGTACMRVEEGKKTPYSFSVIHPGKYFMEVDDDDVPDVISEEVYWTAKQCADRFGEEALHDNMKKQFDTPGSNSAGTTDKHRVIHVVQPRESYTKGLTIDVNRPYAELWIDVTNKHVMSEGGFYENPYIVNRMYRTSDSFWGYSLAMRCLPKVQQLNQMEEDVMLAQELLNDPPWVAPNDGSETPVNRPGGVTYYDASLDPKHKPEQVTLKNAVVHTEEMILRKEEQVRKTFFKDMFEAFADQPKQMTATEVLAIMEQKLVLFTTFFSRYTKEKLNRVLERCLNIAIRSGRIPPPPPEVLMTGGGYKIIYSSRIALAVKLMENKNLFQLIDLIVPLVQVDPTVLQVIKLRDIVRRFADNLNIDPDLLNDEETIKESIEAAQAFQEAMQTAEVADKAAGAMGKMPDRISDRVAQNMAA